MNRKFLPLQSSYVETLTFIVAVLWDGNSMEAIKVKQDHRGRINTFIRINSKRSLSLSLFSSPSMHLSFEGIVRMWPSTSKVERYYHKQNFLDP
jgi:hypothetical protein